MSDPTRGSALLTRIVAEYRRPLIGVGVAYAIGVLTYVFVVSPLAQRVANIEDRDRAAEQALSAAQSEMLQVTRTLSGKSSAAEELDIFYAEVLPQGLPGARRLTSLRLARLAREANLAYERASFEPVEERDSTLTRLQVQMSLSGSYGNVRRFIHALETAPEFVVIDNVQLGEGGTDEDVVAVTLDLSTYFRRAPAP